jgi:TRAP-type C4-dicarboxylate transport system permease small subunit
MMWMLATWESLMVVEALAFWLLGMILPLTAVVIIMLTLLAAWVYLRSRHRDKALEYENLEAWGGWGKNARDNDEDGD